MLESDEESIEGFVGEGNEGNKFFEQIEARDDCSEVWTHVMEEEREEFESVCFVWIAKNEVVGSRGFADGDGVVFAKVSSDVLRNIVVTLFFKGVWCFSGEEECWEGETWTKVFEGWQVATLISEGATLDAGADTVVKF